MNILQNYSLKDHNSFQIDVKAKYFVSVAETEDLQEILSESKYKSDIFVIGNGTNVLFQKNYPGLVVQMATKGINVLEIKKSKIKIEVQAGESWNGLVQWAINNKFSGVENLVLIPGTVGAAAVQNIAAYGQNFEDVFESLEAVEIETGKITKFEKNDCKFGYRESIFKKEAKSKYIITKVILNLNSNDQIDTTYHSRYDTLEDELKKFANPPYNIRDVSKAVTIIRERKFPDWEKIGTAGSFFLNPIITKKALAVIQKKVPGIQYYPIEKLIYPKTDDQKFKYSDYVKVAAGWLLEELGWKGKWIGKVGTSPNQSLVVITQKGATPSEIIEYTNKMKEDVKKTYDIDLIPEVNII